MNGWFCLCLPKKINNYQLLIISLCLSSLEIERDGQYELWQKAIDKTLS